MSEPISQLADGSCANYVGVRGISKLMKGPRETMSSWQLIFKQSRVNHGPYDGDRLPAHNWRWPQGTWFQTRLRNLRRGNGGYYKELPNDFTGSEVSIYEL